MTYRNSSTTLQSAVTPNYVRQNVGSIPRFGLGQHLQSTTLRYDGARHSYLSGKRVNQSFRGDQSKRLGFPLRAARCSLSLRERVRVRGNNANDDLPYGTVPGIVKLDGSSRRARMFPKMTVT